MKQYYINSSNYQPSTEDEAVLSPEDPIHDMIAAQYLGGLNAAARISERHAKLADETQKQMDPLLQYAKQTNIKPGTPAWYALMGTSSNRKR